MTTRSMFGRRRPRSGLWRLIQFTTGVLLVLAVVTSAYRVGLSAGQARTEQLEADLGGLREANLALGARVAQAERRSHQAETERAALQARYAADVPDGVLADLVRQVEAQLEAGIEARRLDFLIRAAGQTAACEGEPATKRFAPSTPLSSHPASSIRFDERIIVTGSGAAARDPQGLVLAWYDPAAPVRVDFRTLDGRIVSVEGRLPLRHEMVVDRREYRFAIIPGERAFIEVTGQACALPEPERAGTGSPLPG